MKERLQIVAPIIVFLIGVVAISAGISILAHYLTGDDSMYYVMGLSGCVGAFLSGRYIITGK